MNGGDAVIRSLAARGIKSIYCLPGTSAPWLFIELPRVRGRKA
jgi:thiamine pyrophosphate-dependent acetolactate synthase large subunit-like protein